MKPPAEYLRLLAKLGRDPDVMWKLRKMLPGQRIAGAGWIAAARTRLDKTKYENTRRSRSSTTTGSGRSCWSCTWTTSTARSPLLCCRKRLKNSAAPSTSRPRA